jgi:hypothetical protein
VTRDQFCGLLRWSALAGQDPARGILLYAGDQDQQRSHGRVLSWRSIHAAVA